MKKHMLSLLTTAALSAMVVSCSTSSTETSNAPHNPLMDHEEEITQIIASMELASRELADVTSVSHHIGDNDNRYYRPLTSANSQ